MNMDVITQIIDNLTKDDIDKLLKSIENIHKADKEIKKELCEKVVFDMIKEYNDRFYQSFFANENNINKLNEWLNKFDDDNIIY